MRFVMLLAKRQLSKSQSLLVMAIAIVGLFDATLLTVQHYQDFNLPCTVTHGCEVVLTSKYAQIFGVPIALFGIIYYFYFVSLAYLSLHEEIRVSFLAVPAALGLLCSGVLVYLQAVVIHAWCQYCILSAVTTVVLFIICIYLSTKTKEVGNGD